MKYKAGTTHFADKSRVAAASAQLFAVVKSQRYNLITMDSEPQSASNMRIREIDDAVSLKPLPSSVSSRSSFSRSQTHMCARCGKPQSSSYHESHPLAPGQIPESDICSRTKCVRFKRALLEDRPSETLILKVHHYYHTSSDSKPAFNPIHASELPGERSLADRAEAVGDLQHDPFQQTFRSGRFSLIKENSAAPVYQTHTAGLQGEGSLAGRVEALSDLQCDPFQQTSRSERLSSIREKSAPPSYQTRLMVQPLL